MTFTVRWSKVSKRVSGFWWIMVMSFSMSFSRMNAVTMIWRVCGGMHHVSISRVSRPCHFQWTTTRPDSIAEVK